MRLLVALLAGAALAAPAHARAGIVADAVRPSVSVYRYPGAKRPFVTFPNPTRDGGRLAFLVVQRVPGWERVRLPIRPNGTTGWIRDRAVSLSLDPYRIRVSLSRHRLQLWKSGRLVRTEPAAVGRTVLPTPRGSYYLAVLLRQPNANGAYGPFAFGTSAFSNALYSFGGGPGQIGLHGTNEASSLGRSVSHGCIRVSNDAIRFFARVLPLGTPIDIVR